MKTKHIAAFLAVAIFGAFTVACSTLTPSQSAALTQIETLAATVAANSISSGHLTLPYAQAVPVLVSSVASFAPSSKVSTAEVSAAITKAVSDGTGSASTGQKIGAVIEDTLPAVISGLTANQAVTAAATGASAGANPVTK
jgi:hypothetical protein